MKEGMHRIICKICGKESTENLKYVYSCSDCRRLLKKKIEKGSYAYPWQSWGEGEISIPYSIDSDHSNGGMKRRWRAT